MTCLVVQTDAERAFYGPASWPPHGRVGHLHPLLRAHLSGGALQGDGVVAFWAIWGIQARAPSTLCLENLLVFSPSGDFQDDMTDSLRDYTNLPEAAPLLTILDMSARAKYVMDVVL